MKRRVLIILCLVGIFAAGGATGAFVALRVVKDLAHEKSKPSAFVLRQYKRMTKELELTSQQCDQVNSILRASAAEIDALRKESFRASGARLREMNQKIAAVLSPEQAVKFEEILRQQRERIRKFQTERNGRMEGRRDGAPPPPPDGQPPQGEPPLPPPGP